MNLLGLHPGTIEGWKYVYTYSRYSWLNNSIELRTWLHLSFRSSMVDLYERS